MINGTSLKNKYTAETAVFTAAEEFDAVLFNGILKDLLIRVVIRAKYYGQLKAIKK